MSFSRYPEYKDSDGEWLGKIPSHWSMTKLRWISRRFSGGTPDKKKPEFWDDGSVPWLNSGAVNERYITSATTFITEEALSSSSAKWIPKKSLVIALAGQGKTKGMVAQLGIDTTCNQSMAAILPNKTVDARYLFWWLDSNYQNIRNLAGGDLRDGLNLEMLGNVPCPIPDINEQKNIAQTLDHETAKIDALIAEQEKLIELLKEKRQAVISHAVTKGLDPNVKMKDSGVEWLGRVPEHWEVVRLRSIVILNPSKSEIDDLAKDTECSFLPMEAIGDDGTLSLEMTRPISEVESGYTYFRDGDVTIAKITPCFENGKGALMSKLQNGFGFGTTELIVVRPLDGSVYANFLYRLFSSSIFKGLGEGSMYGAGGQKRVPDSFVREFRTAIPPLAEQQEIINFIETEVAKLNRLIDSSRSVVSLLNERRSALISAAVTGQIDVRNFSPEAEPA